MDDEHYKQDGRGYAPGSQGTQIKPGDVKNPKGRPKGATGRRADWEREMNRLVTVVENGKEVKIRMQRLMFRRAFIEAGKNAGFFYNVMDQDRRYLQEAEIEERKLKRHNARIITGLEDHFENLNDEDRAEIIKRIQAGKPHKFMP